MASVEPTSLSTVVDGTNPDSVQVEVRPWRLAPFRDRNPADPDFSDAGLDLRLLGDPAADATAVTVGAVDPTIRNGAKRVYDGNGNPALWAEASPQSFDTGGTISGALAGTVNGPAGAAGTVFTLGVSADHSYTNAGVYPILVRPVLTVASARMETAQATMQVILTTTRGVDITAVTRDLWYGYGGSTTIVGNLITLEPGEDLDYEADFQMTYRSEVTEAFEVAIGAAQVVFQVTEYTSTGV